MLETYQFARPDMRGFKLAVIAVSLASARRYVRAAAFGSRQHRELRYLGKGAPAKPDGWCAARARCGLTGKEY